VSGGGNGGSLKDKKGGGEVQEGKQKKEKNQLKRKVHVGREGGGESCQRKARSEPNL